MLVAQQPNGASGLIVHYRLGPPYPIVASAPNNGFLPIVMTGPPGAPFIVVSGPLNPGALAFSGGFLDVGTPPAFTDLIILANGFTDPVYSIAPGGLSGVVIPTVTNVTIVLPPVQAAVADPLAPAGFSLTAASAITMQPTKNVLFLQGDFDPGFGFGPHCRLADTSPVGYSTLRAVLVEAGFSQVTEIVDNTVTITASFLAPYGMVVLGTNQKTFTTAEVNDLEAFVRAGGGLVAYSDSQFGPGAPGSDNQVLSRFGLLTTTDNFGGVVTATSLTQHPVSAGLSLGIRGEGVSIIEVVGNGIDTITNVAPCLSNAVACFPTPVVAPSGSPSPTYSACAAVEAGLGRVVATFDRNTFFNWPGYGTSIVEVSNLQYALNLFVWAGGY